MRCADQLIELCVKLDTRLKRAVVIEFARWARQDFVGFLHGRHGRDVKVDQALQVRHRPPGSFRDLFSERLPSSLLQLLALLLEFEALAKVGDRWPTVWCRL